MQIHISQKVDNFYFYDNFVTSAKMDHISYFFTVEFRKDLREKLELKLPPPLKSISALPCEKQVVNYTALQHS